MTSSGTPIPRWKNATASRRRPAATSSASSVVKAVSPVGASSGSIGGSNSASFGMAGPAAACRATSEPEDMALVDAILARGQLDGYHLAHATRADLLRRLGRTDDALAAYRRALDLARQEPQRRFIQQRLDELARGRRR